MCTIEPPASHHHPTLPLRSGHFTKTPTWGSVVLQQTKQLHPWRRLSKEDLEHVPGRGENGRTKAKERRYREEEIRRREIFGEIRRDGYKGLGRGGVTSQAVTEEQIHFLQGHPEAPSLWVPAHGHTQRYQEQGIPQPAPCPEAMHFPVPQGTVLPVPATAVPRTLEQDTGHIAVKFTARCSIGSPPICPLPLTPGMLRLAHRATSLPA